MLVIPAIDIKDGKCVRLFQGDYSRVTVFSDDPVQTARHWESRGAEWLHLVDLDGAAAGQIVNKETIKEIVAQTAVPVQLGGGLRDAAAVQEALAMGVQRAILGTAALEEPGLVQKLCQQFGEQIVVSIDARAGMAASHGWRNISTTQALDLALQMQRLGVRRIIYTDIARDGTLTQPNYDAIAEMVITLKVPVIASGGVSHLEHLRRLKQIGVEGAIVGRALYTGALRFEEAKAALGGG